MARTDYYGIQTPVLQATSQAIRSVNGTVGTIAPEDYPDLISAMKSGTDYDNVMAQLVEETVSGSIVSITDGANNLPCKNLEVNVTAWQEGTGDPAPDNVRRIHGWDKVKLNHYGGDNLLETTTFETGKYINAQGAISNSGAWSVSDYILVSANKSYIAHKLATGGSGGYCGIYKSDKTLSRTVSVIANEPTYFDMANDEYYIRVSVRSITPQTFGSTLYIFNLYTINLGGTYYGGVLDVTSGVFTGTHLTYILPTTEAFTQWYNRQIVVVNPPNIIQTIQSVLNVYGDVLKATSSTLDDFACWHRYRNVNIIVPDDYTVADYNSNIAGTKIVYPLETPFTVQLTPQQISTLLGNNTFFADTGDINLTYRANGALYVAQH